MRLRRSVRRRPPAEQSALAPRPPSYYPKAGPQQTQRRPRRSTIKPHAGRLLRTSFEGDSLIGTGDPWKGHVMNGNKRKNVANTLFRPSDRPLTEYEEEQKAERKNLERLRTERLAREAAKLKDSRE